ncbi:hypothetical protein BDV95DRAFT_598272 [Massariosphaeria phaeospora]|uniref:NB-ARC domain-containing protein n=1 Tax=Massariosphaeria phaeospora TaxID=100035 RepID=A0A7C8M6G8_9PLEO|nr:hypothetical protein BDV95DRAFT_598272 [Massariosphaeria phaeospora]
MCSQIRSTEEAIILANQDPAFTHVAEHTRGIVFLGTPHRGSSFSWWGSLAARALGPLRSNPSLLQEVEYDALPLLELQDEFERVRSDKFQVVNFFEQRKTRLVKVWLFQWEKFCVREQSATYSRVENIGLSVDHYGLNKFQSKDDNYHSILRKILSLIEPIAAQKQRRLYSVPINTVDTYTERPKLSAAVAKGLRVRHEKASVPYALAIHGLGGTGKTQLAMKYVEDHKDEYSPILWIDAKDKDSVLSSYERCARELQLEIDDRQPPNTSLVNSPTVQAVLRWLEDRKRIDDAWLVFVDNADDLTWGIKEVLPKGHRGSIIITSQDNKARRLVDGGCEAVCVDAMEPLEARRLLLQKIELDEASVSDHVKHDCDRVAGQLGHLALALDLAGAYILEDDTGPTRALPRYLQRLAHHKESVLRDEDSRGIARSEKTVWTVWNMTLERIDALEKLENLENPHLGLPARLLLAFLARFRGTVIQDELFRLASAAVLETRHALYDGAELPSWLSDALTLTGTNEWDDYFYEQTRNRLVRFSLLQRTRGEWPGVSMHGLVQWRATKYEAEQPWEKCYLITVLAACAQLSKETARPHFRRELVAQLPSMETKYLSDLGIKDKDKGFAWHTVSTVYFYEGRSKEAEELDVQVMETSLRVLGKEHPSTLTSIANLASTFWNQGRWKEAEELDVQVMETRKRVLGKEHPSTLTSMANLASTYRNQGRWKEAEELEVQVMETRKRVLGEEHPSTLSSTANLALTYRDQGQWEEAEALFVQTMEIRKRVLGEEHPSTLTSMANLASTYRNQGRWKEAEELDVQVMETRKSVLGKEHPDTLTSMANLASTFWNQGRWKEAEELDVQVMETSLRVLGKEHPSTLTSIANLASTFWNQGRWKEAEELEVQVMETSSRVLGKEHPDTLTSMANLASTYRNQGRWKEAEELDVQVMETSLRVLGKEHPSTLTSIANLASTFWNQGRWKEAEELDVQVMETRKRVLGKEHPDTLASMNNLAFTLRDRSRNQEALSLLETCFQLCKNILGEQHPHTKSVHGTLVYKVTSVPP